ncbi:hypothetical protein SKM54_04410 [Acinetobacter faecalis]|uniref:hypothetical protein n=1 Tax=Acinetobacter faecalis TaxID=2665161 RepID=UPI002A908D7E|nr:hypothetical protein [Acinetobacter faecalis]MDY6481692.1 hypothetical protein [Acinetobacter faecalis]
MINLEEDKVITAYSFDMTYVYCGSFQYHWAKGTGLAANSTLITPPETSAGFTPVFVDGDWEIQQDHRGKVVYSTTDQSEIKVDYVGEIKEGFTESKPVSIFDTWSGTDWIDTRSEEEKLAYKRSQYPKLKRYQFMRGLLEMGFKSSDIEAQIMLIEDEYTRELTMLGFKDAGYFDRNDPSIGAMRDMLDKTDLDIDEFWEYALRL